MSERSLKSAKRGTVSHGTLRTEDLLAAFSSELESLIQQNAEYWCCDEGRDERDVLNTIVWDSREISPDDEYAPELVNELIDALEKFAPSGCYFGAHEGDGADFGFWPHSDESDSDA